MLPTHSKLLLLSLFFTGPIFAAAAPSTEQSPTTLFTEPIFAAAAPSTKPTTIVSDEEAVEQAKALLTDLAFTETEHATKTLQKEIREKRVSPPIIHALIKKFHADINVCIKTAINYDNIEAILILIDEGANLDAALFHAVKACKIESLRILTQNPKTNVNARRSDGVMPLHAAFRIGGNRNDLTDSIAIALIDARADVHALYRSTNTSSLQTEWTPLLLAAYRGRTAVIQKLLEKNAKTDDGVNNNGFTALHMAVKRKHEGAVEILLNAKADANAVYDRRKTPLMKASSYSSTDPDKYHIIRELLIEAGAQESTGFLGIF